MVKGVRAKVSVLEMSILEQRTLVTSLAGERNENQLHVIYNVYIYIHTQIIDIVTLYTNLIKFYQTICLLTVAPSFSCMSLASWTTLEVHHRH